MNENKRYLENLEKPELSSLAIVALTFAIAGPFLLFSTMPLALVLGIAALISIKRKRGRVRGTPMALAAIILSVGLTAGAFTLWSLDAEPIENDWTVADLKSARPDCNASFDLLTKILYREPGEKGVPAIGLTEADVKLIGRLYDTANYSKHTLSVTRLKENVSRLEKIWSNAKPARDIVAQLNGFSEVADLTDPLYLQAQIHLWNLVKLEDLYQIIATLRIQTGATEEAAEILIEFDGMVRKLSPNARVFVTRLVCQSCLGINIEVANRIVNDAGADEPTLLKLRDHFHPIEVQDLAVRNPYIFEYLWFKQLIEDGKVGGGWTMRMLTKPNSLLRVRRNWIVEHLRIEQVADAGDELLPVWPELYPMKGTIRVGVNRKTPLLYAIYNPGGAALIPQMFPRLSAFANKEQTESLQVRSDLLWIAINKRLGNKVSLKARFYGDEYIVDAQAGRILSPGPDLKVGTKDDIYLPIDPKLLGFQR